MPTTRSQVTADARKNEEVPPQEQIAKDPELPLRHEIPPLSPSEQQQGDQQKKLPSVSLSRKSVRSTKSHRLAKADEEIARLKLELAIAQKRAIAAESDDDDDDSVTSTQDETLRRTATWVHEQDQAVPKPGNVGDLVLENHRTAKSAIAAPHAPVASQPQRAATAHEQPRGGDGYATKACPPLRPAPPTCSQPDRKIDLSELAQAITAAARSAPFTAAPHRYFGELPPFNGSHSEWLAFKSAFFESSTAYATAENTARLRRSLRGKAKEAVASLLIVNSNPDDIMKALESRFGRPDAIALTEMEKLRSLPRTSDAPRDVCLTANKIKNCVATLQYLGKSHYLANPETMKNLIEKLTPALRYRWFDYAAERGKIDPDLLQFSAFMDREADRCSQFAPPEQITEDSAAPQTHRKMQRAHVTTNKGERTNKHPCAICEQKGHSEIQCKSFEEANSDDRRSMAKKSNLCYRCLHYSNSTHRCPRRKCERDGCERSHHPMLHFTPKPEQLTTENEDKERVTSTYADRKGQAYLKIIPVRVSGPKGQVHTHALLDDGSTVTLISTHIADQVGATGPSEPLHLETISDSKLSSGSSRRVTVTLQGQDQPVEIQARTIEELKLSSQTIEEQHIWGCKHLQDIQKYLIYEDAKPTILIGQDNWHLLLATETRRGSRHQLIASRTPLGWVLHGSDTRTIGNRVHFVHHLSDITEQNETTEQRMDEQLKHYFALDSVDIERKKPENDPERRALHILETCTKETEDGRYETALLWKRADSKLPSNYDNAIKRLTLTEKRIDKDSRLKQRYSEQMEALLQKGYAERAPAEKTPGRTWYLPHFPVFNPRKPDKMRIVHDAAAKTKGHSLNDHLLTGPDLLQSLPGVLMRFRQHRVAVTADIAEMFMRIGVRREDRDALRYLWRGERRDGPPDEYRMTSLIFGATSSPTTAMYVKNKNAEKYRDTYPAAVTAIIENYYMDDYLHSFKTEEEAIEVSRQVREIHSKGNFDLRGWASNSTQTLEGLIEKGNAAVQSVKFDDGAKTEKVLGLIWKPQTDELTFNLDLARLPPALLTEQAPTKRDALKIVMSVYDPLGLASPVTIQAKKILQEVWRRGTDWDTKIDEDLAAQWATWMKHLQNLSYVSVPRCYLHYSDARSLQLHVFVDASTTAYAAALYWRVEAPDGSIHTSLITAKARVAPLKVTSVPRLELQAAVLGSRMAATVLEEHRQKPASKTYWTDSQTVLAWIKNGARSYKSYVAHRIAAIEETTSTTEWRWVPTKLNVADDATREAPTTLDGGHRWYSGPQFLKENASEWPADTPTNVKPTGEEKIIVCHTSQATSQATSQIAGATPDANRFSRWERLLRTTARVLQFIKICRGKTARINYSRTKKNPQSDPDWKKETAKRTQKTPRQQRSTNNQKSFLPLEASLLREAETQIVRAIQTDSFGDEIRALRNGRATSSTGRLRSLSVVLINDVIHLRGRIDAAAGVTDEQKSPPVLDGNHRATKLWVDYTHRKLLHAGVETTVNECRQHYWILRLRPTAKEIIARCLPCRIRRAVPTAPPTGNLPSCRLAHHHRAFTYTGLDYFGPLSITVGRQHHKRYVALFTCLTMRAVHLELTASISTDSAILALRRFIARRGCPTEIWSDNGTNFHGADLELRRAALDATRTEATSHTISWRFIPPGAPFMGGAWERLVRSVKTALLAALHERHPPEEVLSTLLAEAEYTVNSRPLTHVSVHHEDEEALTPNHLLLGGSARVPIPGTFNDKDLIGRTHWRASQRLADLFWARWLREYLPQLQNRREPRGRGKQVAEGDVVLIVDSNLPRNTWPRGIVIATFPGPDGTVRVADIRTKGGVLRRPVKRIVILPTNTADGTVSQPRTSGCSDKRCTAGEMCETK